MNWSEHIRIVGDKGQALVFFHGWGFDNRVWTGIADKLQDRYKLYLVNLPGFGQSPQLSWESFKTRLLVSLPEQFALVGWSMGGLYAIRLAFEEKERVTHVLNIATTPYFMKDKGWPGIGVDAMRVFYSDVQRDPKTCLKQFMSLSAESFEAISVLPELRALLAGLQVLEQWDMRDSMHTLSCPMYYLFGRLDTIVPRSTLKAMKMRYPECQYLLLDTAAHDPFLTHEAQCIDLIEGFIQ